MPSKEHDIFADRISHYIKTRLAVWANQGGRFGDWAGQIRSTSTTNIPLQLEEFDDQRSTRSPDIAFTHIEAKHPGLIIEVSYSQEQKDIAKIADDYILGTEGNIRTVLGLDLSYKNTKRHTTPDKSARISVWRSSFYPKSANNEVELSAKLAWSKVTTPST